MPNASTIKDDSRTFALFIGKSGSGKKCAACSYPGPIKYFDFDGRIAGVRGANWIDRNLIDYDYYPPRGPQLMYQRLNEDLDNLYKLSQMGKFDYKTIVVGSITGASLGFLNDAIPLLHNSDKGQKKGKFIGPLAMAGPSEYGFQSQAMQNILMFFRSVPVNVIFTAHIVDRWGKPTKDNGSEDTYAESVIVGEKIAGTTDKLAEIIPTSFNEIYKFDKDMIGNKIRHYVTFKGDLPRTSFYNLPAGRQDITDKNFYEYIMSKVKG